MINYNDIISDIKEQFENYSFYDFLKDVISCNDELESRLLLPFKYSLNPFELCNPYPNMSAVLKNWILLNQFAKISNLAYKDFFYNQFIENILIIKRNRHLKIDDFNAQLNFYNEYIENHNETNSNFNPDFLESQIPNYQTADTNFEPDYIDIQNNNFDIPDSNYEPDSIEKQDIYKKRAE